MEEVVAEDAGAVEAGMAAAEAAVATPARMLHPWEATVAGKMLTLQHSLQPVSAYGVGTKEWVWSVAFISCD